MMVYGFVNISNIVFTMKITFRRAAGGKLRRRHIILYVCALWIMTYRRSIRTECIIYSHSIFVHYKISWKSKGTTGCHVPILINTTCSRAIEFTRSDQLPPSDGRRRVIINTIIFLLLFAFLVYIKYRIVGVSLNRK